jgi:hypothetical protein
VLFIFWMSGSKGKRTLATKVYRKPIHTGGYFNFYCNHPPHVKRGLIQSLYKRASTTCQERQDLLNEISCLRCDLQLNCYPPCFIDSVINSKGISRPSKEEKLQGSAYVPCVKGVSKKVKGIRNRCNIWTIIRTKYSLRSSLMKTRPHSNPQQTAQRVCNIPCECDRSSLVKQADF